MRAQAAGPGVTEQSYRERWRWDAAIWGSHCVDCYPGNCPHRVYVRDGAVVWEEQAGAYGSVEPGVPDMNPMGCQKGAAWSRHLQAPDRVLYPLRRAGPRCSGKWNRISWQDALTQISDAIIDAVQEQGPFPVVHETTPAQGGLLAVVAAARFMNLLGGGGGHRRPRKNGKCPGNQMCGAAHSLYSCI